VRHLWINQAHFLARHRRGPSDDIVFEVSNLYDLPARGFKPFDIGIFSGIFYHLPDPIRGLQIVADLTRELLYLSSATLADRQGDELVARQESTTQEISGVHGLAFFPTGPKVLADILAWVGFPATRCLDWWNPPGSAPFQDSVQMVAARDEATLAHFLKPRPAGRPGMLMHIRENVRPRSTILVLQDGSLEIPYRTVEILDLKKSDSALIAEVERSGAEYLAVPNSAYGWLDTRPQFKNFLAGCPEVLSDPSSCSLYKLAP
jgi:hypothetical protein